MVGLVANKGLFAFRDQFGIRPLCFGKRVGQYGVEYAISSESAAFDHLGFNLIRDLHPGEALFVDKKGDLHLCLLYTSPSPRDRG